MLFGLLCVAQFYYDATSDLVSIYASSGITDRFMDAGDAVLEYRQPQGGGAQWARYVHGPNADQPLAMEIYPVGAQPVPGTGQVFYYHADAEGSIRLVSDANGQVANRYEYDSYGKRLSVVEAVAQPFTWKGREWIDTAQMYYNRARFYDPQLGRFVSEDPLGYDSGDTNLYSFGWSNPKNWNDPRGTSPAVEYACMAVMSTSVGIAFGSVAIVAADMWGYVAASTAAAFGDKPVHVF